MERRSWFSTPVLREVLGLTNAICGLTRKAATQCSGSQVDRADALETKCGHFEGDLASNRQPVKSTMQIYDVFRRVCRHCKPHVPNGFARAAIC